MSGLVPSRGAAEILEKTASISKVMLMDGPYHAQDVLVTENELGSGFLMRDEQRYVRSGMRVILGAGTTIPVFRWVSDAVTVEPTVNKKRAILKLRAVC